MACWKLGPALATGNLGDPQALRRSPPLTALRIAGLAKEAGIPDGVFNVLPGFGHTGGRGARHAHGRGLHHLHRLHPHRQAPGTVLREIQSETRLYGVRRQEPLTSYWLTRRSGCRRQTPSAPSSTTREVCTAASRLLVQNSIKPQFMERLLAHAREWIRPTPRSRHRIGAMVDSIQMEQVLNYITIGQQEGPGCCWGKRTQIESGGYYIEPPSLTR